MTSEKGLTRRRRRRPKPELAVKPRLLHYWWALGLFAAFFPAPLLALWVWGRLARFGVGLTFCFLGILFLMSVGLMVLLPSWTRYRKTAYEKYVNDEPLEVPAGEVKNEPWLKRFSAFVYGMTRLEFFGWIIWVTAVLAGITSTFRHIKIEDEYSTFERYLAAMNAAAGDLILASIIGSIVLFFIKLLEQYQDAIVESQDAAEAAHKAAVSASEAVTNAQKITPGLAAQVEKTLDIFQITSNVLEAETLSHRLAVTLRGIAESNTALAQVRELSTRMVARIDQINQEITSSYSGAVSPNEVDTFDLVSLSALYTSYLKVETMTFDGEAADVGRRGCRLSTRYAHYALMVRSVVEALNKLDPSRFEYYALFNRSPVHFFNPERPDADNPLANMTWTALFLEKFCRSHNQEYVPYKRYFVTVDETQSEVHVPPMDLVTRGELERWFILCNSKRGVLRPILWGEAAKVLMQSDAWTELAQDDMFAMAEIGRDILPSERSEAVLSKIPVIQRLPDPSYIVLDSDDKKKVEQAVKQDLPELQFQPLRDVLLTYHSQTTPPEILKFESSSQYKEFFGKQIPQDLLAVRDKIDNKWCLCIGSMVGSSDPTAVEMIYMTEKRQLRHLSWERLTEKLTTLFMDGEGAITRDQI